MKKFFAVLFLFTLLFGFGSSTVYAEEKVGYVDLNILIESYAPLKKIHEECIEKHEKALADFEKEKSHLTVKEQEERKFMIEDNFNLDVQSRIHEVLFANYEIIAEVVKKQGIYRVYVYAGAKGNLAKGRVNLTQEVLQALNEKSSNKAKETA